MEESRKRSQGGENNEEAAVSAKRARTPATLNETDKKSDANNEEIMALLSIGEQGYKDDLEAVTVEVAQMQAVLDETVKISDAYNEDTTAFFSIDEQGDENDGEAVAVKIALTAATSNEMDKNSDADCEDISALLSIDEEEAASELGKLLETTTSKKTQVRIIDDPYYSLHHIFQPSSSYLTINGNEESCGSSYSEKESSVMAGFDIVRRSTVDCCFDIDRWLSAEDWGAWFNDLGEAARGEEPEAQACAEDFDQAEAGGGGFDEVKKINGWDCFLIDDDDMLARFVGENLFDLDSVNAD